MHSLVGYPSRFGLKRYWCQTLMWFVCWSQFAGGPCARAAATGPVLPAQSDRAIDELTTLIVTNTATESGLTGGPGSSATNTYIFNYSGRTALLNAGWNFIATAPDGTSRNTEITNTADGAVLSYDQTAHPGVLRVPCDVGDLWGSLNTCRNGLFRALPTNWMTMQLALSFAPAVNFQQVHLAFYKDDDNFVQAGLAFNSNLGGLVTTLIWEFNATPNHFYDALSPVTSIRLRLDRNLNNGDITQLYSLNGGAWTTLGTTSQALANARLCVWVGGSAVPWTTGLPSCDLQRVDVMVTNVASSPLTYQLVNAPAGAAIDANGIITWTPSEAQGPSTNLITTIVTDNRQSPLRATNSFTVVVNEVNTPPVLPAVADRSIVGVAPLIITNTAADGDLPPNSLSYQLTTAPANAAIDANGVITWVPSAGQLPSTNLFTTIVTDSNPRAVNSRQMSATNTFTVVALAVPPPQGPVLPGLPDMVVNELAAMVVTNTASEASRVVGRTTTNTYLFSYSNRAALIADGWSFSATAPGGSQRNTETLSGAGVISYDQVSHPGLLRIPCDQGDLWGSANSTRNMLLRSLPSNWVSAQVDLVFAPNAGYQQAHLSLYADDDNYYQVGMAYNAVPTVDMSSESGGSPTAFGGIPAAGTTLSLRLSRNLLTGGVTGSVSFDGSNWTELATTIPAVASPRLAVWTGGALTPYTVGSPVMDLRRLSIVVSNNAPTAIAYSLVAAPQGMVIDPTGIISWLPGEADGPGTNRVTTVATDNGIPPLSATNSFLLVVQEQNTPPALPAIPTQFLAGLQRLVVTNAGVDFDIPANGLSYALQNAPAGAAIDANGVISWTPVPGQVPSTNVITTIVTDDNPWAVNARHLTATNSFQVVVGAIHGAPLLAPQPNLIVAELTGFVLTNTATANDLPVLGLAYTLLGPPAGAAIDTNGIIRWTPTEAQGPATNVITTVVTDNGIPPLSATNSFIVVVQEVNTPPVLPFQPQWTLHGLEPLAVTNTAVDSDLPVNSVSYRLEAAPPGAAIDTNGIITWLPGTGDVPSTNLFTTVVTDFNPWAVNEQQLSGTNTFAVVVLAVHNGPALPVQTNWTVAELTPLILTNAASANDIPSLQFSYALIGAPAGAAIDGDGVISWTPAEEQGPATNVITTVVTDNGIPPLSATNSFMVVVQEVNTPPVLPLQQQWTLHGLEPLTVTNTAVDSDLPVNTVSYRLEAAPPGAAIDANGIITWTPTTGDVPSTNVFTTVVTDFNPWAVNEQYLSGTNTFEVVVQAVHHGPRLPNQPNVVVAELTELLVTNTATANDLPALALSYLLIDPPPGASVDTNGVISWIPTELQGPGTNAITTLVFDSGAPSLSVTNQFEVVVEEINSPPSLPILQGRTLEGGQLLVVTNVATDSDFPPNSIRYLLEGPEGAIINSEGIIAWLPQPDQVPSTNVFTTIATDDNPWAVNASSLSATNTFTVVVVPPVALVIESLRIENGMAVITWDSAAGGTYRLQFKEDLAQADWIDAHSEVAAAGASCSATNVLGTASVRFYRIVRVR
jgi:hypothetical protein